MPTAFAHEIANPDAPPEGGRRPRTSSRRSRCLWRTAGMAVMGAAVSLGLGACSPTPANLAHGFRGISQATRAAAAVITISNTGYQPVVTQVQAGSNILVINAGDRNHTVTAVNGAFGTGVLAGGGDDGSFIIKTPGTYRYYDELNPDTLQGEIIVTPAPPS